MILTSNTSCISNNRQSFCSFLFLSRSVTRLGDGCLVKLTHGLERFYDVGYQDGYAHGRLHGLIEGRALGAEKGFDLWEELGFYEGVARLWAAVSSTEANGTDGCVPQLPLLTALPLSEPLNLKSCVSLIHIFSFLFLVSLFARIDVVPITHPRSSP
jgi:Essential protein Yae1, N terminal